MLLGNVVDTQPQPQQPLEDNVEAVQSVVAIGVVVDNSWGVVQMVVPPRLRLLPCQLLLEDTVVYQRPVEVVVVVVWLNVDTPEVVAGHVVVVVVVADATAAVFVAVVVVVFYPVELFVAFAVVVVALVEEATTYWCGAPPVDDPYSCLFVIVVVVGL